MIWGRFAAIFVVLLGLSGLSACQEQMQNLGVIEPRVTPRPKCPVYIGVVTSLSGRYKAGGQEHLLGYEMAVEELNERGGVLGCPVELVIRDDESEPHMAGEMVKSLAEDRQKPVWVIMGSYSSGTTIQAAGVANVYNVPFLVPTASSDLVTELGYEWVFRINAPSSAYAATALDFVREAVGVTATVAIVYEESLFGESAAVAAARGARERGLQVVAYESYQAGDKDYVPLLERVKNVKPDVLYFASGLVDDAQKLIMGCDQVDLQAQVYLGHAGGFVNPRFLLQSGQEAEYLIVTAQWSPDVQVWVSEEGESAAAFADRFARWGRTRCEVSRDPAEWCEMCLVDAQRCLPGMRSAQTFVTLQVAAWAIETAEARRLRMESPWSWDDIYAVRRGVRDALARGGGLSKTIFGPIRFDQHGQNAHPVLLLQVLNNHFVTVYPPEYRVRAPVVPAPLRRR